MTQALQNAIDQLSELTDEDQDKMAVIILEELHRTFQESIESASGRNSEKSG